MREEGALVYPVYSRRSGGLSVGINLFPDVKRCSFNCPYCEVLPFATNTIFSQEHMEEDLRAAVSTALEQGIQIKDICFSGNGEPTMSEDFPEALKRASRVRSDLAPTAKLVLITNGFFLLNERLFSLLEDAASAFPALDIWLKLDAGTSEWYKKINMSVIPHEKMIGGIKAFAARAPVTIQTMICAVDGEGPPPEENEAWEKLILSLAAAGNGPKKVQIYGKARPGCMDPKSEALPIGRLEDRAVSLRQALTTALADSEIPIPPVEVYP